MGFVVSTLHPQSRSHSARGCTQQWGEGGSLSRSCSAALPSDAIPLTVGQGLPWTLAGKSALTL